MSNGEASTNTATATAAASRVASCLLPLQDGKDLTKLVLGKFVGFIACIIHPFAVSINAPA